MLKFIDKYALSLYISDYYFWIIQADWKPEVPERFGDIAYLTTSLSTLKIEETKKQGSGILIDSKSICSDQLISSLDVLL